ncbi:hypothetical protein SCARR_05439 [Pontiella sulfatireligans]|uniref:Uncharacterized protein n=1 Tax=Pontiella sulfatireligans TaxID=2750658 RepID=A0A6C2USM2_9BACT|nr:hypothetical protein SCARR_05439 [Pontiella sulfatireligans]
MTGQIRISGLMNGVGPDCHFIAFVPQASVKRSRWSLFASQIIFATLKRVQSGAFCAQGAGLESGPTLVSVFFFA